MSSIYAPVSGLDNKIMAVFILEDALSVQTDNASLVLCV